MTKIRRRKFDIRHKETLTLFLREYFELFFPELAEIINFKTAKFLDKELIALFGISDKKDNSNDQQKITDALILVQILMKGKPQWIMIHWEQESQRKNDFEERMFHYFCGIYYAYRMLVFPIAMFTDPVKWRKPGKDTFKLSLLQHPINEFTYRLIKLKNYQAAEFEKQIDANPLAAAYLPLTDYPKNQRPLIKAKALEGIAKVQSGKKKTTLFSLIQESITLNQDEEKQFQKLIESNFKEAKMLESIEEYGIEKGMLQASYEHVIEILNVRFKHVPDSLVKKIQSSDDLSYLSKLLKKAILTESIEAFDKIVSKKAKNN
ncbi:hypothetical protein QUF75_10915 [Desulfococcaceae bacterium HSG7]|nr:hypothetical protein [Desulfococcaceae bacterium HSG7]